MLFTNIRCVVFSEVFLCLTSFCNSFKSVAAVGETSTSFSFLALRDNGLNQQYTFLGVEIRNFVCVWTYCAIQTCLELERRRELGHIVGFWLRFWWDWFRGLGGVRHVVVLVKVWSVWMWGNVKCLYLSVCPMHVMYSLVECSPDEAKYNQYDHFHMFLNASCQCLSPFC